MDDLNHRWRVVVVDDHPIVRAGLRAVLAESPELDVVGDAGSAAEALAVCGRVVPDVVLLDMRLPDRSGVEVCRELKQQQPEVKVLFLTSYGDEANVLTGLTAGADGYLLKTITGTDIAGSVAKVAAGGCILDPQVTRQMLTKLAGPATGKPAGVLSETDYRLLELVTQGRLNKEIATTLGVAEKTVRNQMTRVFEKLGVTTRTEAALWFARRKHSGG